MDLQGRLRGVVGSAFPTTAEKKGCVVTVARCVADGWAIAADPRTLIGRLAEPTAETACVPFLAFSRVHTERCCGCSTVTAQASVLGLF
jgi:hypothetical protein